ncbi:hypothetical protein ACFQ4L_00770 [Lapidilactobacillus mulanensis]|uniref:Uncharacterized protein n=1 Tax=Lapidilactobacillus mulanensis TaxID=2485999 RepID=A0ABW4DN09_9LACO|nr:hypothetical protein [Lapidilactobacillus mulanensis]
MKSKHFLIVSAAFLLTTSGLVTLLDSVKLPTHTHHRAPVTNMLATITTSQHLNHSVRSSLPKGLGWNFFEHPNPDEESER